MHNFYNLFIITGSQSYWLASWWILLVSITRLDLLIVDDQIGDIKDSLHDVYYCT